MAKLSDFMVSKVRVKMFKMFLLNPEQNFYVRQIVRHVDEEINAVRRELIRMEERSLVKKEQRGNRLYYTFKKDYLFYPEFVGLIAKTSGIGEMIIKNQKRLGKVQFAAVTQRFLRKRPHRETDVDLLIIGDIVMAEIIQLVKEFETKEEREINYSVMTADEFDFRKKRKDQFIINIMLAPKVMLVGDEEALVD